MQSTVNSTNEEAYNERFFSEIYKKSDKIIEYFLFSYFVFGLLLAFWYDTWLIAVSVGGILLAVYFLSKKMFPGSTVNQYVASVSVGVFTGQFIYQMHGLFEMHFFAFIGSALMITYQNWKVLIPVSLVVAIHHGLFAYLEYIGYDKVYFTTDAYDMDLLAFVFHILLAVIVFFICSLWSYNLEQTTRRNTRNVALIEELSNTMMKNMEYASLISEGKTDFTLEPDEDDLMGELLVKIKQKVK
jgi:hypothetical protein